MHYTGSGFRFAASLLAWFFQIQMLFVLSVRVFGEAFLQRVGTDCKTTTKSTGFLQIVAFSQSSTLEACQEGEEIPVEDSETPGS